MAPTVKGIRKDHVARYEWAANRLSGDVYDLGCGVGYGSKILADAGCQVHAADISAEAIAYARQHYASDRTTFVVADLANLPEIEEADAAVVFEIIEHLEDPRPLLKELSKRVKVLLASVPNEDVLPWNNTAFHVRHYKPWEFAELLRECGWSVVEAFTQQGPESPVEKCNGTIPGRTLIAHCVPSVASVPVVSSKPAPKRVAIVGMGPSKAEFINILAAMGSKDKLFDEVWAINALGDVLKCDLIFHMDDVRIQMIRAAARPESNIAAMVEWMKTTTTPIMTSRLHPDFPALVEMPLQDLVNDLTFDYMNNTAAWALAYAIHIGVEKVGLYGCDFTYPNSHDAEKGRGCVEFWLGYAAARGVKITLPKSTSLMDACYPREDRLYGYDTRTVAFERDAAGKIKVTFTEVDALPTADEIEHRYDHSRHPNVLVEEQEG